MGDNNLPPNVVGGPVGAAECAFASLTRSVSIHGFVP